MSRRRHMQLEQLSWELSRCIKIAYAEGVEMLLGQAQELSPSPAFLGLFVHAVLEAPTFAEVTDFRTNGHRLDNEFLPKRKWEFEGNQRKIVATLARYNADMLLKNRDGLIPAERAFFDMSPAAQKRAPARFEIVAQTLQQQPSWLPDVQGAFRALDCLPEDSDAKQRRAALANNIGDMGCEVGQWLQHWCEPHQIRDTTRIRHAPVYGDMPTHVREYWTETCWNIDADKMPWGDTNKIRANRDVVEPHFTLISRPDGSRQDITDPVALIIHNARTGKYAPRNS